MVPDLSELQALLGRLFEAMAADTPEAEKMVEDFAKFLRKVDKAKTVREQPTPYTHRND